MLKKVLLPIGDSEAGNALIGIVNFLSGGLGFTTQEGRLDKTLDCVWVLPADSYVPLNSTSGPLQTLSAE